MSPYPWSKRDILCAICNELDIKNNLDLDESKQIQNDISTDSQSSSLNKKETHANGEEILITWSSVFKVSLGALLILVSIYFGIVNSKLGNKKFPFKSLPSSNVNSLK